MSVCIHLDYALQWDALGRMSKSLLFVFELDRERRTNNQCAIDNPVGKRVGWNSFTEST